MDMVATPCCCHSTSQLVASPQQESSGPKERLLGHGLAGISRREAWQTASVKWKRFKMGCHRMKSPWNTRLNPDSLVTRLHMSESILEWLWEAVCLEDRFRWCPTPDTIAVFAIFQARNARVAVRQLVSAEAGWHSTPVSKTELSTHFLQPNGCQIGMTFLKRNVAGLLASGAIRYTNFEYLGRNRGLFEASHDTSERQC